MSGGSLLWQKTRRAKPAVTWQTYNRGGVLYGSYDEMLISLLPRKVENQNSGAPCGTTSVFAAKK